MLTEQREQRIKSLKNQPIHFPEGSSVQLQYERADIEKILPHRPPFALLDRIVQLDLEHQMIRTETRIAEDDPVFQGHFPGHPIYPGVLQIEMMGQAGLCLIYFLQNNSTAIEATQRPVKGLFTRVHNAGFIHPVYPGDTVTVRAEVIEYDDFLGIMGVQVFKGDRICAHSILESLFNGRRMNWLPHQVDLWYCPIREIAPEMHAAYLTELHPDERVQHDAFHFERDRLRYLLTRRMVRQLLSECLAIPARELLFTANEFGRPALKPEQNGLNIDFNISHSPDFIICGLLQNGKIGVDIESHAQARKLEVAADFFAPQEVAQLHQQPAQLWNKRFIEFWALKESFIKAMGKGLAIPLDSFYFNLESGLIELVDLENNSAALSWDFWMLEAPLSNMVSVAVAFQEAPDFAPQLRIRAFDSDEVGLSWVDVFKNPESYIKS